MKDSVNVVKGAAKIVRNNLIEDETLYDAFVENIESALLEMPTRIDIQCMAKRIADRIIGRENND